MSKNFSKRFPRKCEIVNESKKIFIFTEGEKTEPNYFKSKKSEIESEIRRSGIEIKIKGIAHNTLSLVNFVLDYISRENIKIDDSTDSDECWVVFDKDDFDRHFDNAINKAETNNLKVAYSNEAFELWFLLHFNLHTSAIGRNDYIEKLDKEIKKISGKKYKKNLENIYSLIKNKEKDAIRNAKKILIIHKEEKSFLKKNPSTTVHLLIESLNKLKE